ncbi:hypothetical protein BS78_07G021600 [Paspalum vaginatum]|nr:hypothetical protein BS78_07G021600 [Paspalum vaginatum]
MCWTHGNFVARRKRSGFFSFLPGPRTLFFFELAYRNGSNGIVTCTPLDEPVTEAYSVLGFPLWWSTRLDLICETCRRRFDVPRHGRQEVFACGHSNVDKVCEMCYLCSEVLHPYPGDFAFGYHEPYRSYY